MKDILRRAHRTGDVPAGAASPDDLWVRCPKCKELLYKRELEQNLLVCSKCKYHFHVTAPQRIAMTADVGTFKEIDSDLPAVDPLHFVSGEDLSRETGRDRGVDRPERGLPVRAGSPRRHARSPGRH